MGPVDHVERQTPRVYAILNRTDSQLKARAYLSIKILAPKNPPVARIRPKEMRRNRLELAEDYSASLSRFA